MAFPKDGADVEYRGVEFIEMEEYVLEGDDALKGELVARFVEVKKFGETICGKSVVGKPFFAQMNFHFHQLEPPPEWAWSKTPKRIKDYILNGLIKHGEAVILQKERMHMHYMQIRSTKEREHVLKQCDLQLFHVWQYLDAFACFDKNIKNMQSAVNHAYEQDPLSEENVVAICKLISSKRN